MIVFLLFVFICLAVNFNEASQVGSWQFINFICRYQCQRIWLPRNLFMEFNNAAQIL